MIQCQNISLAFKEKVLFEDFNFQVNENEFVTISGESGRGKSTLLKMLQGYVSPDKGMVMILGATLNEKNITDIRQFITWIPQNINLPVNSGKELAELMDISDKEDEIHQYLHMLGLDAGYYDQDFQKISGGQKQRIIVAICLSMNKPIILMDEPTASLDESSIRKLLKTIQSLKGKTIISASHNSTWLSNSDRVIEL